MPTKPPESPTEAGADDQKDPQVVLEQHVTDATTAQVPVFQLPQFDTPEQGDDVSRPTAEKPVVLATPPTREFVIPGDRGIHITPDGVAMSEADADAAKTVAAANGIELVDITEQATQQAEVSAALAHFQNKEA